MPFLTIDDLNHIVKDEERLGNDLLDGMRRAYTNTNLFTFLFSPGVFGAVFKLQENTKDDGELLRAIFFLGCYVGATRQKLSKILK